MCAVPFHVGSSSATAGAHQDRRPSPEPLSEFMSPTTTIGAKAGPGAPPSSGLSFLQPLRCQTGPPTALPRTHPTDSLDVGLVGKRTLSTRKRTWWEQPLSQARPRAQARRGARASSSSSMNISFSSYIHFHSCSVSLLRGARRVQRVLLAAGGRARTRWTALATA